MTATLHSSFKLLSLAILSASLGIQDADARSGTPPTNATGAPGSGSTCVSCHGGSGNGNVSVSFSGSTEYTPGQMYTLMVTVTDPGKQRFGFSMVARDADNATVDTGTWAPNGPNTQVYAGGTHVGHASAPFAADTFTFTVDWTAPATGVGDVRFYIGANGANGTGTTSGDSGYLKTFTFSEAVAAPTAATLTGLFREPDGTAKFTLSGGAGETYTIEHSANLENWFLLEERTLNSSSEQVTDSGAIGKARRFYRATPGSIPP